MLYKYFLGILFFVGSGYGLYDSNSNVRELTPSNFYKQVTDTNDVWLVEFYAPWCRHCKNLVPAYKKAAQALQGMVKVGALDADKYSHFAKQYGVTGYPTIKIFTGKNRYFTYKGSRTAEALVEASLKALKDKAYARLGTRPEHSSEKVKALRGLDNLIKSYITRSRAVNHNMW